MTSSTSTTLIAQLFAQNNEAQGSGLLSLLIILIPMGAILYMTIVPQRKQRQRHADMLRRLDVGSVDIRRRGLAGEVDRARRAFRLTGTRRATVAMTRVDGRPWALICLDRD